MCSAVSAEHAGATAAVAAAPSLDGRCRDSGIFGYLVLADVDGAVGILRSPAASVGAHCCIAASEQGAVSVDASSSDIAAVDCADGHANAAVSSIVGADVSGLLVWCVGGWEFSCHTAIIEDVAVRCYVDGNVVWLGSFRLWTLRCWCFACLRYSLHFDRRPFSLPYCSDPAWNNIHNN